MASLSPMMQQYFNIKECHSEHILFFRLGDFYEMFFEDAVLASKELGLTLTGRDCGLSERAPMCGVPHHSSEGYIAKLIKKGYKVAICEQTEDPAYAKGIVSREVVRVITPGTLVENNMLQEDSNNYLCCVCLQNAGYGLAFADISTGEVNLVELENDSDPPLLSEFSRYIPREIIFSAAFLEKKAVAKFMREKLTCTADLRDDADFNLQTATNLVLTHFGKDDLASLNIIGKDRCVCALGALLAYLHDTQKVGIERLVTINVVEDSKYMNLDGNARANLELVQTLRTKEKRGSLLWVLDKTKTAMGKRLIKNYINQPLISAPEIEKRLNAVGELYKSERLCGDIMHILHGVFDIERLVTRIVYGNATPREYKTLEQGIASFPELKGKLENVSSILLKTIYSDIDILTDIKQLIAQSIKDEPAASLKDGGVISEGYNPELDELLALVGNARELISKTEQDEKEKTGIKNLKISYNRVFGYYIEITKSYLHLVPERYIRKQTLAGSERYIVQELKELEDKILSANDKIIVIEQQLFEQVRQQIICQLHRLQRTALAVARLDVFCSFAKVSLDNRYTRPEINMSDKITIKDGRHPVVEQLLDGLPFVPNDTALNTSENQIMIITGPNMAGKSTYMRQCAVIVLMAQIGCFVPASSANIGVVDGIFTRIGAADDMTTGQSTFMVEMCEVADILKNATPNSLLILDEIGRGTSTYDGMSIARAVIEYIADTKKLGAKTLFATHYHELTEIENHMPHIKNYSIAAKKRGDDITFLRKIIRGPADDSYGIEVSKLAGIPPWIIKRAHEVLQCLETARPVSTAKIKTKAVTDSNSDMQISFEPTPSPADQMLKELDLNTLTPIEALTILYKLKAL